MNVTGKIQCIHVHVLYLTPGSSLPQGIENDQIFQKMVRTLTLNHIYTCHDASNGIKAMGHWESWSPWKTKLKLPNFVKTIKILIPKPYTVCEINGRPIDKIEHVSIVRRIFVDRLVYRRNAACHRWNVLPNAFLNASW